MLLCINQIMACLIFIKIDWWQEKGTTEDEIVWWYHWLNGRELANSRSWWWTGRPDMLQSMGSKRVGHDWATELNWTVIMYLHLEFLQNFISYSSVNSITQSCPTLCDPIYCSTPGLPVHHKLPEFTQTHVHWVGDAIHPSHPLLSPSHPAFNLSQHQGLFQWVSSSHQVPKVLEFQLQHQSFPVNIQDWFPLGWSG